MRYFPIALLVAALLLTLTPAMSQEYGFRVEPLTVSADYTSLDVSGDAVVAVGKAGLLTVWRPGRIEHVTLATSDLSSVSCMDTCVAVGKGGIVSDFDPSRTSYRTYTLFRKDPVSVAFDGRVAVISATDELYVYSPGGEVLRAFQTRLKVSRLTFSEGAFLGVADKTVVAVSPEAGVERIADYDAALITAFKHRGSVWALTSDGLYVDDSRVLQSSYTAAAPHPRGVLLLSGTSIQLYDAVDRQVKHLSTVTRAVSNIRLYAGDRVVASGPTGALLMVGREGQQLLTAPPGEYVDAVSDGSGGVWLALKNGLVLRYLNDSFTAYVVGDQPIALTYSGGRVAVLGSRWLWRLEPHTGEVVKVEAAVRGSDFRDIAPSVRQSYWVTLVGATVVDVSVDGRVASTNVGGRLTAVTRGYAVGDKIAAMIGDEPKVSKQNTTLAGVDATQCGAVAVGKNSIVYLKPEKIESVTVPNADLRTVSVNPRGAYALAGGSKGVLALYDGYRATVLPTALPEDVVAVAWVDGRAALAATPKAVYRLVETFFPDPRLEVVAPRPLEVFTGTSRRIAVEVRPLNGMSGDVELHLSTTNPQIVLQQRSLNLKLSPMCTARAEIGVSIPAETPEGAGSIIVSYKGLNLASISLALKRPGQQPQQVMPLPAFLNQGLLTLAVIAVLVPALLIANKRLRGR